MIRRLIVIGGVLLLLAMSGPAPAQEIVKKVRFGRNVPVVITVYIQTDQASVRTDFACEGPSPGSAKPGPSLDLSQPQRTFKLDLRCGIWMIVRGSLELEHFKKVDGIPNYGLAGDIYLRSQHSHGVENQTGYVATWDGPVIPPKP